MGFVEQLKSTGLTKPDIAAFLHLGVLPDLLLEAAVRRVTTAEAGEDYGIYFAPTADLRGIVFPYLDPQSGRRLTARLRRDNPEVDAEGKQQNKYLSAFGDTRHLYFAPLRGGELEDVSVAAVFVEAEKSALALRAWTDLRGRRLLAIATGGCWGWVGKTGIDVKADGSREERRGPLPDFYRVAWTGRRAVILFDANISTNWKVRTAERALADVLSGFGAHVRKARIPKIRGVNGPDDLIARSGGYSLLNRALRDALPHRS